MLRTGRHPLHPPRHPTQPPTLKVARLASISCRVMLEVCSSALGPWLGSAAAAAAAGSASSPSAAWLGCASLSAANMEKRAEDSSFWMCTTSMYVLYTACGGGGSDAAVS